MIHSIKFKDALRFTLFTNFCFTLAIILWHFSFFEYLLSQIDILTFKLLNWLLSESSLLQTIFGILNHKKETKLNLVFMALVNIYCIFKYPKQARWTVLCHILFFWAFFQLGFMYQDWYFIEYLGIRRESPSLVMTPYILLSEALANPLIKDASDCCFPSGHASAILFWYGFSRFYMPPRVKTVMLPLVILFLFPRVVSGAHWLSDVLFSCGLALSWLGLGLITHVFLTVFLMHVYSFLQRTRFSISKKLTW